jgi:hypothetical protein
MCVGPLLSLLAQATQPDESPLAGLAKYEFADYVMAVLGNLLSNAIVAAFIVTGLVLLYLQKKFERLQADKDTHVAYAVAQHRRKEQTLTDFTDGIPQNLSMVHDIFLKRSYLKRMAKVKPEDRDRYMDGRSYKQISLAYERDVRVWLTQCQHFTSLCTQVRSRFDSPIIHETADQIRRLFEQLIELTPALPVVTHVADEIEKIATTGRFIGDVEADLASIRAAIAKTAALPDNNGFDRVASLHISRVLAGQIDKLFMHCVDQMSAELRQLPVAGLKASPRKSKQIERGLALDQKADKLTTEGETMHQRKQRTGLSMITWLALGLMTALTTIGCTNYGGSVPIDDDAGFEGGSGRRPAGSVDASVPIDDDAGMTQDKAPKP